jgi:hypothetical protein
MQWALSQAGEDLDKILQEPELCAVSASEVRV